MAEHQRFPFREIHVQFASYAEFIRQVDPGLDGEAGSRQQATLILGLQIIDISAIPVDLLADRVPRAVQKPLSIPGGPDHLPTYLIHFPAAGEIPIGSPAAHEGEGLISRLADDLENLAVTGRHAGTDVARPRNVCIDTPGLRPLRPEVDEHKVSFTEHRRSLCRRSIMRNGAMSVCRSNRRAGCHQSMLPYTGHNELLESVFRQGSAPFNHGSHMGKGFIHNHPELLRRLTMGGELPVAPDGLEALHQIGGGHHLDAEASDQLHRPRIHTRQVRHGIHG